MYIFVSHFKAVLNDISLSNLKHAAQVDKKYLDTISDVKTDNSSLVTDSLPKHNFLSAISNVPKREFEGTIPSIITMQHSNSQDMKNMMPTIVESIIDKDINGNRNMMKKNDKIFQSIEINQDNHLKIISKWRQDLMTSVSSKKYDNDNQ